jgi:hypothetical protein
MGWKWIRLVPGVLAAACGPRADDAGLGTEAPPPAAALSEINSATPLDQGLVLLRQELAPVIAGELGDEEANSVLMRAEALTDRLLETRLPFQWLTEENYGLDARLRQIQALADRVVAQLRSGVPRDSVIQDVRALDLDAADLREALARGGTRAPPPLDQLLSDYQASRRPPPRPAAPPPAPPTATADTTTG